MFKKYIIILILASIVLITSLSVNYQSIQESEKIRVEIKGAVNKDKILYLEKGTRLEDVIDDIELNQNSDLSSLSLNNTLYNNQIIVIPEKNSKSLVSINSATLEQLITLPGIGESTAKKIITYRNEMGSFTSIEELMNVSGIGEVKFSKIKELITL